jgi:large subunit ribosomal protein L4
MEGSKQVQIPVYNIAGAVLRQIEVSDYVFATPFNEAVVHQAMVRQRANARQGTADTKTRSEVSGTTKKIYRQKHTGMARVGDRRSPLRYHGGVTFGPHPRDYSQDMPKKMRRLAFRCVLSAKVTDGELTVVDDLKLEQPKTREMEQILSVLGGDSSVLIVTSEPERNVILSARNISGVKTLPANQLNITDMLTYKTLLITEAAVRKAEQIWGEKSSQGGSSEPV